MLALALLAVLAATQPAPPPTDRARHPDEAEPIALTVPEIRRLLTALLLRPAPQITHLLHWSTWRRRHQATARRHH